MKNNKEYYFHSTIESIDHVVDALRDVGYNLTRYRKCDFEGQTISYRILITEGAREYEVATVDDCLMFIVNDPVMLGEMVRAGSIVEG
jgi:hypothetical protein